MQAAQATKTIIIEPEVIHRGPLTVWPGDCLNQRDAAVYAKTNRWTLGRLAARGEGPPYYQLGQRKLYPIPGLDAWKAPPRRNRG